MRCLQVIVKFLNLLLFVVGLGMIFYSLWMLREFKHGDDAGDNSNLFLLNSNLRADFELPAPWFIYCFIGVGAITCLITFFGYVAAEVGSGCCLCCHSVSLLIFLFLQAVLAATIFFDHTWEKDFPEDPTGQMHQIRSFVETNLEFCKWIALSVVILEVLTLLFGLILRAVIGDFRRAGDDSDDELLEGLRPSFRNRQPPSADALRGDAWSTRYAGPESRRLLPQQQQQQQQQAFPDEGRRRCSIL